ncbi:MAG: hypothetical protein CPDRYMAC_0731 [uncultured Paraburkholderia sp.]|nr:MAG: hypothetical protein CPDRYDRY_0703 [uncultured Paraburkholderia sp.]CAH2913559.1 MAG: hypothetical protein CPDRYMAC_0731 [uncultured Paraburkholderia sp.]
MTDIFLKIDGIRGESQEIGHVDEIEVISWTWNIHTDARYLSGAGKATMNDMEFVHHIDCASPNLMRYALKGTPIPKAILTMHKSGGVPLDFQKFTLENVLRITGVKSVGASGTYVENLKLFFSKVKQEYTSQNAMGGSAGVVTAVFDIRENREA